MRKELTIAGLGAAIALILQLVLAPALTIFQVTPSFVIVYSLVLAMVYQGDAALVIAFALGMLSDLIGTGPVGALAFLLVLAAFLLMRLGAAFSTGTVFFPFVFLAGFALAVELLYAAFLMGSGSFLSPLDAFLFRALPCALFDCVIGLFIYPLMSRLLSEGQSLIGTQPPMPRLR